AVTGTRGLAAAARRGGEADAVETDSGAADGDAGTRGRVAILTSVPPRHESAPDGRRPVITADGRRIALPSSEQVVRATMRRPLVRGAVLSHGLRHALRPENRDRIRALVRRDYE